MKKILIYIAILVLPFLGMIAVNEYSRSTITEQGFQSYGITTINSNEKLPQKCSWQCYNNTIYCKENHVKYAKPYFASFDLIYFGIIDFLQSTGNYAAANLFFLVFLIPFIIYILTVQIISLQFKIRKLKSRLTL